MSDTPPVPPADGSAPPPPPAAPAQPAAPQPGYAQPAYGGQPGYYAPPTNTLAIVALVLAFVFSIVGAILGHVALGQIKRTGEGGHGIALAAVIVGWVFTGIGVLVVVLYIVIFAIAFSQFGYYGGRLG